jgi:lipopolysaccharide/colanic/teichoic acid biosynthesis glycosyltransferase
LKKRALDILIAAVGLMVLSPIFLVVAILIKFDSRGPALFRQERVGKGFKPFRIYKFRTMVKDAAQIGSSITCGDDPRITRIGRFLRKTKVDELPQFLNVLRGEMSLVGPRPEVRRYVECFRKDYEEILKVRPGITDLASVKYRDEATILSQAPDPEEEYRLRVLPEKIRLGKEYIQQSSLLFDVKVILRTLVRLFWLDEPPHKEAGAE